MHLAHLLNLVKIYDEASLLVVVLFDALSAKHRVVVGAVEVLHSLLVHIAKEAVDAFFVFKVNVSKDAISLHDFI